MDPATQDPTASTARVLERLAARREQLFELAAEQAAAQGEKAERLLDLARQVEEALGIAAGGAWGVCVTCSGSIEPERLECDPLVRLCLDCLSREERRALERDLRSAAQVQRNLLPPPLLVESGWEMAYLWEPHGAVSGDHVDVVRPPARASDSSPLHLMVGDVVGKGVAASLLQAHVSALFRALAPTPLPLPELLTRANRLFCEATSAANFATLVALRLLADGTAQLANAGHPRPLLADARGVRPIEGGGRPLGLFCDSVYSEHDLQLPVGATLFLYTDGLTEAAVGDEEYGIGRAAAALRRATSGAGPARSLPEILAACRADLETFLAGARRSDDLTLVALRRIGG